MMFMPQFHNNRNEQDSFFVQVIQQEFHSNMKLQIKKQIPPAITNLSCDATPHIVDLRTDKLKTSKKNNNKGDSY